MGKTIAVIGGAGKMGRWLTDFLLQDDHRVVVSDTDGQSLENVGKRPGVTVAHSNREALSGADVVLLSVPIESFDSVVIGIGPHVLPGQAVIDITSTKVKPVEIMHKYIRSGTVLGAHPLFGPGAASITNKNVVLTPSSDDERELASKLTDYLESRGARVSLMTPEQHDDTMSLVLGLSHFIALVTADTLLISGELHPMDTSGSSTYKVLLTLIESVLSEDPELYASIQMNFPRVSEYEKLFGEKTAEWAEVVAGKDRREFVRRMQEMKNRLQKVAPDFVKSYEKMYRIVEGL